MTFLKALLCGASLVCWACGGGNGSAQAVEDHRQQWLSNHPQDYVVEICGTGFARGCTLSAVSVGKVVAARQETPAGMVKDVAPAPEDPVVALFDRTSREARSGDCNLKSLKFDPVYAFVSDYYCDYGEEGSGEQVTCFKPNTADLAACPK